MKNIFYSLTLFLSVISISSCSSDDSPSQAAPEAVNGTTWYRQETTTQSGQSVTIDFYLVFESASAGHLEAETNVQGNNISQMYDFDYEYAQGHGTAYFDDSNIGTQEFVIHGNTLTLDGENLTKM